MLAIIIVVLGALAVIAIAFSSYLSMLNSSNQMAKSLEEKRLVNDWVLSLQQSMRPFGLDRTLVVPNGQELAGKDYQVPPSSINLSTQNSWGKDIIYCPFAINKGTGTDIIKAGDGETYLANVVTGSDGIEYIYSVQAGAAPTGTDLVAALISPLPTETSPSCADIAYDIQTGDYYTTNYDGVVYPVLYNSMIVSNQASSIRLSASSSESLSQQVDDWTSILPDVLNITLDSNASSYITSGINFINEGQSKTKSIVFRGNSPSTSVVNGSDITIVFENVTVSLSDMSFGDGVNVEFINSDVTLDNVSIYDVTFEGANVYVKNSASFVSVDSPVEIIDSKISSLSATLNIIKNGSIGANLVNSKVSTDRILINNLDYGGAGVVVGNASSLLVNDQLGSNGEYLDSVLGVASGGSLSLSSINVEVNNPVDTFLFNQGDVYLDNLFINFNSSSIRGIILGLNSDTVLNRVQIGSTSSSPAIGVEDLGGAKFIGGFNTLVYAQTNCWLGDIFVGASAQATGSTSEAQSETTKSSNRSVWTCNL